MIEAFHKAENLIHKCIKSGVLRASKNGTHVYVYMRYKSGAEEWTLITIKKAAQSIVEQNAFSILEDALQKRKTVSHNRGGKS